MTKPTPDPERKGIDAECLLVVEPDVVVRMAICEYLRECGYKVLEAVSAAEALKVLAAGIKVDAVFSETRLEGGMDGFALAQRIRSEYPGTQIMLTSSNAMTAKKAGDLCDEGPVEKPYHHDFVLKRLRLLLRHGKSSARD